MRKLLPLRPYMMFTNDKGSLHKEAFDFLHDVSLQIGSIKAQRATATVVAGTSSLVTLTWDTPFSDANYTVTCSVQDSTPSAVSTVVIHLETITASDVQIRVNNTSAGSLTVTLHVIAIHD